MNRDYVLGGWGSETATDRLSPALRQHGRWLNGDSRTARKGREHLEAERDGVNEVPELWDIDRLVGYLSVSKHFVYRLTATAATHPRSLSKDADYIRPGRQGGPVPTGGRDRLAGSRVDPRRRFSPPRWTAKKGTAAYP